MSVEDEQPLFEWSGAFWFQTHLWISALGSGTGSLYANLVDVGQGSHTIASVPGLITNQVWQHVALTYDKASGQAVLYLNGSPVAQQQLGAFTPNTSGDLFLGLRNTGDGAGIRYAGWMDEPAVYNRALSAQEISNIFTAGGAGKCGLSKQCATAPLGLVSWWKAEGNGSDSAGQNPASPRGGAAYSGGMVGQGFVLNGTDADLRVPASESLNVGKADGLTLEAWVRPRDVQTQQNLFEWSAATFGVHMTIAAPTPHGAGGGSLFANLVDSAGGHHYLTTMAGVLSTGYWQHVALTFAKTSGVARLFINGAPMTASTFEPFTPLTSGDLYFGVRPVGDPGVMRFAGDMDEVALYNRALTDAEINAIYRAGELGKCNLEAPRIASQPSNIRAQAGDAVTFNVQAIGALPLSYQWLYRGSPIPFATNSNLTIPSVSDADTGTYFVIVSNRFGTVQSDGALLSIFPDPVCAIAPTNIISWWTANDGRDSLGGNHGSFVGNATSMPGRVGTAFAFDGQGDAIAVGQAPNLRLQDFTIELWVKRADPSIASHGSGGNGVLFGFGTGGYALYMNGGGGLALSKLGIGDSWSPVGISDTNWHHVAVTKSGSTVRFFVDGVAYSAQSINAPFEFTSGVSIGARPDNGDNSFLGLIDELAVYGRPLGDWEVENIFAAGSAGKCPLQGQPPFIVAHPVNRTVFPGETVSFTVSATGTEPLFYQWRFQGAPLPGATQPVLALTNVYPHQSGLYTVGISNAYGAVQTSAMLNVTNPPSQVRIPDTSAPSGTTVVVPITLVATGKENALGFSLNFFTSRLTLQSVVHGDTTNASIVLNTTAAASGRVGILVAAPFGQAFSAGTQTVVQAVFTSTSSSLTSLTPLWFGDEPVARQVSDVVGNALQATFASGNLRLLPSEYEADVAPRPNGDSKITVTDWVTIGRFAAQLDGPTNASEFRRADCAPRSTLGDGNIGLTDWVQAGRYAVKLDPQAFAGGPEKPSGYLRSSAPHKLGITRQVSLTDASVAEGDVRLSVRLDSDGRENALAFSIAFDSSALSFVEATIGSGLPAGSLMQLNTGQLDSGKLGVIVAAQPGQVFAEGMREVLVMTLRTRSTIAGSYPVTFTDVPVRREVSDAVAELLVADFASGMVKIENAPALTVSVEDESLTLTWPLWATNYTLQAASGAISSGIWTNVPAAVETEAGKAAVKLPVSGSAGFYRLHRR